MTTPPTPLEILTKEETAWLIKTLWASLQAPAWTFKNRKDLEKLGEAIFSGKSLKELDDGLYERIFPHLVTVATHLGRTLKTSSPPEPATEPAQPSGAPKEETPSEAPKQAPTAPAVVLEDTP